MRITPADRLSVKEDLKATRLDSRPVYVCIPTITKAATFDGDTQTGVDVSAGDGTGRTVTWSVYKILGHIRPIDQNLVTYGQVPPGVLDGDMTVGINVRDKDMLDKAYLNQDAYLYIDGSRFRIMSFVSTGIGKVEQWSTMCKIVSPLFVATGY